MKRLGFILLGLTLTISLFSQENKSEPNATFLVFSDPHYYDPSLGLDGDAFQDYLDHDRKLLRESRELIQVASDLVVDAKPDFLLVPGDLTKDGTLVSHEQFAALMGEMGNPMPIRAPKRCW